MPSVHRTLPHTLVLEHVAPATRLLEKRRQMFEVQEALEQQKREFFRCYTHPDLSASLSASPQSPPLQRETPLYLWHAPPPTTCQSLSMRAETIAQCWEISSQRPSPLESQPSRWESAGLVRSAANSRNPEVPRRCRKAALPTD